MESSKIENLVIAAYEKPMADKIVNCIRHNSKQGSMNDRDIDKLITDCPEVEPVLKFNRTKNLKEMRYLACMESKGQVPWRTTVQELFQKATQKPVTGPPQGQADNRVLQEHCFASAYATSKYLSYLQCDFYKNCDSAKLNLENSLAWNHKLANVPAPKSQNAKKSDSELNLN